MILLIDNYDSFTYNLYQYLCELGAEVTVRRNDAITVCICFGERGTSGPRLLKVPARTSPLGVRS